MPEAVIKLQQSLAVSGFNKYMDTNISFRLKFNFFKRKMLLEKRILVDTRILLFIGDN